jgi:hypothetical protein
VGSASFFNIYLRFPWSRINTFHMGCVPRDFLGCSCPSSEGYAHSDTMLYVRESCGQQMANVLRAAGKTRGRNYELESAQGLARMLPTHAAIARASRGKVD